MYPGTMVAAKEREPEYSYAGLIVRADRAALLDELVAVGFSGWVGPAEGGSVVLVCRRLRKAVTAGGHDLTALAVYLALRLHALALAVDVHRDRVLRLALWDDREEVGRYLSDPAYGADEDDDVFPEPEGVEHAAAFAAACGHPDAAEALAETLAEMLDEEEQTESERLWSVLRLLGLPSWLVASTALPKHVPGGPLPGDVTLLFRGRTGRAAAVAAWALGRQRRRKR
jgi:hypothetical protein